MIRSVRRRICLLEAYAHLGREDAVPAFMTDVAEWIRTIQVKNGIAVIIVAFVIGLRCPTGRRGVVEYIVNIYTEVDALAFHEFDVFAYGHVQRPTSRTRQLIDLEIAYCAGLGLLENDCARVAGKSDCVEILSAAVLQAGGNSVALRIIHLYVHIAVEKTGARAGFPGDVPAFCVK